MPIAAVPLADEPPWADELTLYDETHFTLYLRLLDAVAVKAPEREICQRLLELDPVTEPRRAHQRYKAHLRRAQWFTTADGLRHLVNRENYPSDAARIHDSSSR